MPTVVLEHLAELAQLGIEHAIFGSTPTIGEPASLDLFASEVIPQADKIQAAGH